MAQIRYVDFLARFRPRANHLCAERGYDGRLFETFGLEVQHVLNQEPRRVWTLLDCGGNLVIAAGRHFVNRLGYFVCEVPCDDALEVFDEDDGETTGGAS